MPSFCKNVGCQKKPDKTFLDTLNIKNYKLVAQGQTCGEKGGLVIYIHEDFEKKKEFRFKFNKDIWESQFVEITASNLNKKFNSWKYIQASTGG